MGRIDRETVNRILDTADIVEVVSDFVKLRRSGANYKGLCPFHNERTPSFSVNRARNICKCFSCGKGGSPVNFIMEHEQMSYQEALRYLARKYNIEIVEKELSPEERQAESEREAMLAVNEFALKHFEDNLTSRPEGRDIALPYFRHRGINDAMIARFHLGYAIDRGDDLLNAATTAGFDARYLVSTGLEVEAERDGHMSLYDRFRGRVIFPIHSISGRVVGFGGRTMRTDKNVAKYVNSPESVIYKKNLELYGFYQAKSAIARRDKAIMVEGYLDVISMHQAGVENVVASSGTSLTEGQIRAIRRFTTNVTLIYDADAAGIKASLRGINMLLAEKMDVHTVLLPPGDDPDSFAQNHTASEVEEYLATHETDIITFMTGILMKDVAPNDPTGRAKVVNTILEPVSYIDEPVKRQEYISQCSRLLGLREEVIVRQLNVLTTRRLEAEDRNYRRDSARQTIDDVVGPADASAPEAPAAAAPAVPEEVNTLRPYEEMLARYLVRYGLKFIADIARPDGTLEPGTVYDIIAADFDFDGLAFTVPAYRRIFEAVGELRRGVWNEDRRAYEATLDEECRRRMDEGRRAAAAAGGSLAGLEEAERRLSTEVDAFRCASLDNFDIQYVQNRLLNSDDDEIRRIANALATERYSLSKIYLRQSTVENEQTQLPHLVPRAVNELRGAILRNIIAGISDEMAKLGAGDEARAAELMEQLIQYKDLQKRLVKTLGERIILP
ncbi:MAG: DNA primase [Muribaculaceae bacterium]|nr:DNA primase [Muribaculaceae bacterium]